MFIVSFHWLQFTIPEGNLVQDTIQELSNCLDSSFESVGHGSMGYENMAVGIAGARVLTSDKRPEHHVILPGEWCEAVGPEICSVILGYVFDHKGHFTRLDLAGDDYSKVVKVQGVAIAIKRGQLVSHCHNARRQHGLRGETVDVIYIGSKNSRRLARIYDKEAESDGRIDAIRWELQLRDEAADRAAKLVLSRNLPEAYLAVLVGFADFKKVSNDNTSRRPRAAWFKKLVGQAQKATLALHQPVKTIEDMEIWVKRQVSPTLSALVEARGGDMGVVEDLLAYGQKHMKTTHRMAIEEALRRGKLKTIEGVRRKQAENGGVDGD